MKLISKVLLSLALASSSLPVLAEEVSYAIAASKTDQYAWVNPGRFELGRVSLEGDIVDILQLNTSVGLVDQGWGNQDPTNGVFVGLFAGDTELFRVHVAGSDHSFSTDVYSLTANAGDFNGFNAALDGANRDNGVSVRFYTDAWGYPGWELHTRNATLDLVASTTPVPEPATYAMMFAGVGVLLIARRRRQQR